MEKNELTKLILVAVVSVILGGAFVAFYFLLPSLKNGAGQPIGQAVPGDGNGPTIPGDGKSCPMDAKLCSDGSYAGRSGPNCEFICPNERKR